MSEQDDIITFTVHLPFVTKEEEQVVVRNLTLAEIAASIRKRKRGQQVLVQGDFNIDWLPAHQCDPVQMPARQDRHTSERMHCAAPRVRGNHHSSGFEAEFGWPAFCFAGL